MLLTLILISPPLLLLLTLIQNYLLLPSQIPGPFLASFTNLWRLLSVYRTQPPPHLIQQNLHSKHGDIVRLGPNVLSLRGAHFVPQIYGINRPAKNLRKSSFYACFQNIVNGKRAASLVAMTDESQHARTKRAIAHAYSLSKLVEFEVLVDSTVDVFLTTLSARFATKRQECDLGQWLQFFAFDVIGELTFSKRLGFLESGEDINGIIAAIGANFRYFSVLGQMPWLDNWLGKNPLYVRFFRKPVSSPILLFAQELLQERLEQRDGEKGEREAEEKPDFLNKFLAARKDTDEPELMGDRQLLSYLFMNINAASDTISSTLKGIFYGLLMNPSSMAKLVSELDSAKRQGNLTTPTPTWTQTQSLPYLNAVIKEGLRTYPALGLSLERVVPPEGMTLSLSSSPARPASSEELFLPAGTVVGINPYIHHRSPLIFGADAESFRPERWLTHHEIQTKEMEHQLLSFGAASALV